MVTKGAKAGEDVELLVQRTADGVLSLTLLGRLDARTTGHVWRLAEEALGRAGTCPLVVDASSLEYCDISGIGLIVHLRRRQRGLGASFDLKGPSEEVRRLLDLFGEGASEERAPERGRAAWVEQVGQAAVAQWRALRDLVAFVGHLTVSLARAALRRQKVRWNDAILVAEAAGLNALPIVALIGFTMGLIIAFQSAVSLRRFAAEIYVPDAVILAMFREMAPLFTAIVLAGRSGSAFAAEIGTMKVNEEVDALQTMGLDPVPFLAVPRVMAGVFVTPLLTAFADLSGLIGGGLVFASLGFPPATYVNRLLMRGDLVDFFGGLFKSLVYGILVAAVGCHQGLQTGSGARAVGESTTRSVVAGIILIVIADAVLSVVYYVLEI
jgi:phospholipid/cholesterol/gamma-HCH transport system permease protein